MSTAAAVKQYRGCEYMPIKLKGLLIQHGITQPTLASVMLQKNGDPISKAAMSQIINWGYWPRSTPKADLVRQAEEFLRKFGIDESEMATLWDIEGHDDFRAAQPLGVHLGKASPKPVGFRRPPPIQPDIEPVETEMLSPVAKRHFKLFRDPFKDEINGLDDVFLSEDQRYVAEAMYQTAKHGGFLAVVGESGSGKSTLRKVLLDRITGTPIRVVFPQTIAKEKLSSTHICAAIINDLAPDQTVPSSAEAQARKVRKVLLASAEADYHHVLLIEEAHDLSIATLKLLKRFYEIEDGFRKLLSIILVAQPEMHGKLNERNYPEAREVIRRIEVAELAPLGNHTQSYLAHKFGRVNADVAGIFDADAYEAIHSRLVKIKADRSVVSGLYPLTVNNLVVKAMNKAAQLGVPLVSAQVIREV